MWPDKLTWVLRELRWRKLFVITFRAQRSVSRLCPIRIVSALMKLSKVSCTSRREVWWPFTSSSLMPENLCHKRYFRDSGTRLCNTVIQNRPLAPFYTGLISSHLVPLSLDSFWTLANCTILSLPCVIVDHLIIRPDKSVIDNSQAGVNQRHSGQLQTLNGVTLWRQE